MTGYLTNIARWVFAVIAKKLVTNLYQKKVFDPIPQNIKRAVRTVIDSLPNEIKYGPLEEFFLNDKVVNILAKVITQRHSSFRFIEIDNEFDRKGLDSRTLPIRLNMIANEIVGVAIDYLRGYEVRKDTSVLNFINPFSKNYRDKLSNFLILKNDLVPEKYLNLEWYRTLNDSEKALALSVKNENLVGIIRALERIGEVHINLGNYEDARYFVSMCLSMPNMDKHTQNRAIHRLGWISYYLENLETARRIFTSNIELAKKSFDDELRQGNIHFLARIHYDRNEYEEALSLFKHSLKMRKDVSKVTGRYMGIGHDLRWISRCYRKLLNKKQGSYFLTSAQELLFGTSANAHILIDRGREYLMKHKIATAIDSFLEALYLWNDIYYRKGIMDACIELGKSYELIGDFKESVKYYSIALEKAVYLNSFKNRQEIETSLTRIEHRLPDGQLRVFLKSIEEEAKSAIELISH